MNECSNCGMPLARLFHTMAFESSDSKPRRVDFCDGLITLDADPFQEEIRGDSTEYWDCEGNRRHSWMEI